MNDAPPTIQLTVNGEARAVPAGQSLEALLADLGLPAQAALVEHNGVALLRGEWLGVRLTTGDRLEIMRVVAGG